MTDLPQALFTRDLNPGPLHKGEAIWLPQLIAQAMKGGASFVEGRTFVDCRIEGPAVLLSMGGCTFDACNMGYSDGDVRNLLLRPMGEQKVIGAIGFKDCLFQRCSFFAVGFTGAPAFLDNFMNVLGQQPEPNASGLT